jgi:hypothetical protein
VLTGGQLKDRYNYAGRFRLETAGDPHDLDNKKQAWLDLWHDEAGCTFQAS